MSSTLFDTSLNSTHNYIQPKKIRERIIHRLFHTDREALYLYASQKKKIFFFCTTKMFAPNEFESNHTSFGMNAAADKHINI